MIHREDHRVTTITRIVPGLEQQAKAKYEMQFLRTTVLERAAVPVFRIS